jgi:hypothetical protein
MNIIKYIQGLICPKPKDDKALYEELSLCQTKQNDIRLAYNTLQHEYDVLSPSYDKLFKYNDELISKIYKLENPEEKEYPYILGTFIKDNELVTDKYIYNGTVIKQHLTDLLDSSYTSRRIASEIIKKYKFTNDSDIKEVFLKTINYLIREIKYVTNKVQYGSIDIWDNGDLALVSGKGDCDLSTRATIRVLKDIIYQLKLNYDSKDLFLYAGYYVKDDESYGHAWLQFYLNDELYLAEMTRDNIYGHLVKPDTRYIPSFCHNNRVGFEFKSDWDRFL